MKPNNNVSRGVRLLAAATLIGVSGIAAPAAASAVTTTSQRTAEVSEIDKQVLIGGMVGMYFETEFGQLARAKATNPKVRAYGEQFLNEHGAFRNEIIAQAEKHNVALPTELPPEDKKVIESIAAQEGAEFDAAWAEGAAVGHQGAVIGFKTLAPKTTNPEIKALTVRELAVLEKHYASALALARELGTKNPDLINAGEGPAPTGSNAPLVVLGGLLLAGTAVGGGRLIALRRSS